MPGRIDIKNRDASIDIICFLLCYTFPFLLESIKSLLINNPITALILVDAPIETNVKLPH